MAHVKNPTHQFPLPSGIDLNSLLDALSCFTTVYDKQDVLKLIIEKTQKLLQTDYVNIYLVDSHCPNLITRAETSKPEFEDREYTNELIEGEHYDGLTGWVFATGQSLRISDVRDVNNDQRGKLLANLRKAGKQEVERLQWADKAQMVARGHVQNYVILVPIVAAGEGRRILGVIRVCSMKTRKPFDTRDEQILTIFADRLSLLIERVIKSTEIRDFIRLIGSGNHNDLPALFQSVVGKISILMNGAYCSIYMKDEAKPGYIVRSTSVGGLPSEVRNLPIEKDTCDAVTLKGLETSLATEQSHVLKSLPDRANFSLQSVHSKIVSYLIMPDEHIMGAIVVERHHSERGLTANDQSILDDFASTLGHIIDHVHRETSFHRWANATAARDPDQALKRMLQYLSQEYNLLAAFIRMYDPVRERYDVLAIDCPEYEDAICHIPALQQGRLEEMKEDEPYLRDNNIHADQDRYARNMELAQKHAEGDSRYFDYASKVMHALTFRLKIDGVPLAGTLSLRRSHGHVFTPQEAATILQLVPAFVQQIVAIKSADKSYAQAMALKNINVEHLPSLPELLRQFLINLRDLLNNQKCNLKLIRRNNEATQQLELIDSEPRPDVFNRKFGLEVSQFEKFGEGGSGMAAIKKDRYFISNTDTDEHYKVDILNCRSQIDQYTRSGDVIKAKAIEKELDYRLWIKSVIAVPMLVVGELDGVLTAVSHDAYAFDQRDVDKVYAFSQEVAPLLRLAAEREERVRRTQQVKGLHAASHFLWTKEDERAIYNIALIAATHPNALGFCRALILVRDGNSYHMPWPLAVGAIDESEHKQINERIGTPMDLANALESSVLDSLTYANFYHSVRDLNISMELIPLREATLITPNDNIPWHRDICSKLKCERAAVAPIRSGEELVGIIITENTFSKCMIPEQDIHLLEFLADEVGGSIAWLRHTENLLENKRELWDAFVKEASHRIKNKLEFARKELSLLDVAEIAIPEKRNSLQWSIDVINASLNKSFEGLREFFVNDAPRPRGRNANLNRVLVEVATLNKSLFSAISTDLDRDISPPDIEDQALSTIIEELMQNAHRAGAREIRISTRYIQDAERVQLEVWNDGEPISPDIIDKVFCQGVSTAIAQGGWGYGLDAVKRNLENVGGNIRVDAPDGGVRFTITIPTKKGEEANGKHINRRR